MHRFSIALWLGAVLFLGGAARGQGYPQRDPDYRNDPNYQNYPNRGGPDGYSRPRGDDPRQYGNDRSRYERNPDSLVGQVLSDLDRAAFNSRLDGHERKHFEEAARNLQGFEGRLSQGKFDTGKLDEAIEELKHLANADRVNRRDRPVLARDLEELREYRANRGRFSNEGYGGYGDDRYNQNRRSYPDWR